MSWWSGRRWAAPVATTAVLAVAWGQPWWSELPEVEGITVTAGPQLHAPGEAPAPSSDAGFDLTVGVEGAGEGHQVDLEMWADGRWRPDGTARTDADGRAHLMASHGAYGRIVTEVDGRRVTRDFDAVTAGPALAVNDDFDAGALGASWVGVPQPTDRTSCSMMGDLARSVEDGQLVMTVREDPTQVCGGLELPLVVNGHVALTTPIIYGTVAARIKMPTDRSVTGQFWLQPGDPAQPFVMDDEHEGVVIAQTRGPGRAPRVGTSVNVSRDGGVDVSEELIPADVARPDGEFHVYAVTWTEQGYSFSVDGREVRSVESAVPAPPLSIGLAVLPSTDARPQAVDRTTMHVDWLRVWAL